MEYTYIDMSTYPRRKHFDYFRSLAYPYVGMTVNLDVTEFVNKSKAQGLPFFLSLCYCVAQAANGVPEFRQRIKDGGIIQYDWCQPSHTLALEDGSYCYCVLESNMSFREYLPKALEAQALAVKQPSLDDGEEVDSLLFVSSIPFISYSSLVQPVPCPADSNPRISWGKYFRQGDRLLLPVSVLCNHALVDAIHISRFYATLDMALTSLFR